VRVPGRGSVTGNTRIRTGTSVRRPSAVTASEASYRPGFVPYGTSTWTWTGWFGRSLARSLPSQGSRASGTAVRPTAT
jgi:hypothetical protein